MGRASKTPEISGEVQAGSPIRGLSTPKVIVHQKEDGGHGTASMASKPFEPGLVEPMQRNNPEYLHKLADEKILSDIEAKEKREKALKSFGSGRAIILGASPNSPLAKKEIIF